MNAPHDETPPPGDDAADAPFDRGRLVGDLDAALAFSRRCRCRAASIMRSGRS